jgi:hypothetical protein
VVAINVAELLDSHGRSIGVPALATAKLKAL